MFHRSTKTATVRPYDPNTIEKSSSNDDTKAPSSPTRIGFYMKKASTTAMVHPSYPPPPPPLQQQQQQQLVNLNDRKFLNFVQLWLVIWLQHIYNYMERMRENVQLADELNRTKLRQMIDLDISQDSAISSGSYSPLANSDILRGRHRILATKSMTSSGFDTTIRYGSTPIVRMGHANDSAFDEDVTIHDMDSTARLLIASINETKYITAVFEVSHGGIASLIDDILDEFRRWFDESGLLAVACEVHWSVPETMRNRTLETRMKDGIHAALRANNRKVLDLKSAATSGCNRSVTPLALAESTTQENCYRETKLDCFQGIYRRFYSTLLPYQHKETASVHEPFWKLSQASINSLTNYQELPHPNPKQFLFGANDKCLIAGSLVAVNLIALKVIADE